MAKILLVDYPYADGIAREKCFKNMGYDAKVFNLVKSRIWSGPSRVKEKLLPVVLGNNCVKNILSSVDQLKLNIELIRTANNFRPDIVFVIKGDKIYSSTIRHMKNISKPAIVNWYADSLLSPDRFYFIKNRIGLFDHFFIIDEIDLLPSDIAGSINRYKGKISTLPFAANTDFYDPAAIPADIEIMPDNSVSFIGTINPERANVLRNLTSYNLKIFGPKTSAWGEWLTPDLEKAYQNRTAFGINTAAIYAHSSIVIDIHFLFMRYEPIPNVTARVFEVPACGGFILTNYSPQIARLFEIGKEIVCYSSIDDLKNKIKYYLLHPEEKKAIAQSGRERILKDHTFTNRIIKLLKTITGS